MKTNARNRKEQGEWKQKAKKKRGGLQRKVLAQKVAVLEGEAAKAEQEQRQLEEEKEELWKEKMEEEEHRRQAEQKCRDLELELEKHVNELAAAADINTISRLNNKIASLQDSLKFSAAALLACRTGKGNLSRRSRASDIKL